MAHHKSTPQSIIDAPSRTFTALVIHEGATRQERRHGIGDGMKPQDEAIYMTTANHTHTSTRERKIRRGRKARFNRSAS
jgi:hypothetical protein